MNENAANGTIVGITTLATDDDATNNAITYTLDDTAGGRFAIDSLTGVVTVADGTLLDREAAATHNITVRATSSDGSFNTAVMTINLIDVDEFDVGTVTDNDGRQTKSPKTSSSAPPSASPPQPAMPTRRTIRSRTHCLTMTAASSPSTPTPESSR